MICSPLNGAHIIRARRWAPTLPSHLNVRNVYIRNVSIESGPARDTLAELQKGKNTPHPRCLRVADKGLAGYTSRGGRTGQRSDFIEARSSQTDEKVVANVHRQKTLARHPSLISLCT